MTKTLDESCRGPQRAPKSLMVMVRVLRAPIWNVFCLVYCFPQPPKEDAVNGSLGALWFIKTCCAVLLFENRRSSSSSSKRAKVRATVGSAFGYPYSAGSGGAPGSLCVQLLRQYRNVHANGFRPRQEKSASNAELHTVAAAPMRLQCIASLMPSRSKRYRKHCSCSSS